MSKRRIENLAAHIARLQAERELADSGAFTTAEIAKLDQRIRESRREIVDALSVAELTELKKRGLRPEQAGEVVHEPVATVSDELKKIAWAAINAASSDRRYFIAEKGFAGEFVTGRPLAEAATGDTLRLFKFAPARPSVSRATIADAFLNHAGRD